MQDVYRYTFGPEVPLEDIEDSLTLCILSVESLHGEAQVQLDVQHLLDQERRICVIDARTAVGRDLNRLFVGFLMHEFKEDQFCVERINAVAPVDETTQYAPAIDEA